MEDVIQNINNLLNKYEVPKLGTKEFNDMCENYFSGNPNKNLHK